MNPSVSGLRSGAERTGEPEINTMSEYLSKDDMNRLIDCCIAAELREPFLIVDGISNNTRLRLSNEKARVTPGYEPRDDAIRINNFF